MIDSEIEETCVANIRTDPTLLEDTVTGSLEALLLKAEFPRPTHFLVPRETGLEVHTYADRETVSHGVSWAHQVDQPFHRSELVSDMTYSANRL